jgi:cytochrome oxidase Cu insertion factor (SCO1/SenC/PrrC family)
MKKQWAFSLFFAVFLVFAGAVIAGSGKTADVAMAPAIGATIDDFTLPDADGKDHSLSSLRGKNGARRNLHLGQLSNLECLQRAHGETG